MAGITLAQARTKVARYLNDASNERWSTSEIDDALADALSTCIRQYAAAGGDRFNEEVDETPDSNQLVDLSSYDPIEIAQVWIKRSGFSWPISYVKHQEAGRAPTGTYDVRIFLIRTPVFPDTTTYPLVQSAANTAMKSWREFDQWVCVKAAIDLSTKDGEGRPDLVAIERQLSKSIMNNPVQVRASKFPKAYRGLSEAIRYTYEPSTQKVGLVQERMLA